VSRSIFQSLPLSGNWLCVYIQLLCIIYMCIYIYIDPGVEMNHVEGYLTTLLIPQFIQCRKWMNFLKISAFDERD
jgi:hypothetical protein